MKYLLKFNEGFNCLIKQKDIQEWGITIEDLEDILIELSDHSRNMWPRYYNIEIGGCEIKNGRSRKVRYVENNRIIIKMIPEIIVLSEMRIDKLHIESILNRIINKLSSIGIVAYDSISEQTEAGKNLYHVVLRLIKKSDVDIMEREGSKVDYGL